MKARKLDLVMVGIAVPVLLLFLYVAYLVVGGLGSGWERPEAGGMGYPAPASTGVGRP